MTPSGHAVGDDGGEERFNRAEQCERDRVRQHGLNLLQAEMRQRRERKVTRNAAELRSDRLDGQFQRDGRERSQRDNDQHRRPARSPDSQARQERNAHDRKAERGERERRDFRPQERDLLEKGPRFGGAEERPSSGLISLEKIVTAMPAVKPTVTG